MDLYTKTSYDTSKLVTTAYSTSFGLSIRLFEASLRPHIYAIYGLVRIAVEIVDTYQGSDQKEQLDALELQTKQALASGYSTNPVVHAFAQTARTYHITNTLIAPFFKSMRMDLAPKTFDQKLYDTYIYGSAEVVGLMCLKVFTSDDTRYSTLEPGAKRLGAAYQKVNFLRDIAADAEGLGRWYFPTGSFAAFDAKAKDAIVKDIEKDFAAAAKAIVKLPDSCRKAVTLSHQYYSELLKRIKLTSADDLKRTRIRVNNTQKAVLFIRTAAARKHDA
jgi:phytoene synthase